MLVGTWGRKIGMTQCFLKDRVVPLTAIDVSHWYVVNMRYKERDGYDAVQVGLLKERYQQEPWSASFLKNLKKYFLFVREIRLEKIDPSITVGMLLSPETIVSVGDVVHVTGITKGAGFAGVIRRHGFNGPRASHGSTMGKRPGSSGCIRRGGKVFTGKRFPGHMGAVQRVMRNLEIIQVEPTARVIFVKGSIPGKGRSLVYIKKSE